MLLFFALVTDHIYGGVAEVVKQVAPEEKIQVVIVRSQTTVLWAKPERDLTNRIITRDGAAQGE